MDVINIIFSDAEIEENDGEKLGMILDYDKNGYFVGIKIIHASKKMHNSSKMEYMLAR